MVALQDCSDATEGGYIGCRDDEVAARFEYAVHLSNGYAYIWMDVVQTANYGDAVKRIISKTGTEQRPSFRFAIGPSVSERIYDLA